MVHRSPRTLMIFSITITLFWLTLVTNALSNVDASSSYVSVRALDNYGNAIQLSHAKEAAQRHGRSVVVAVVDVVNLPNNGTDDLLETTPNEETQHQNKSRVGVPSSSFVLVISMGRSPILHPIQLPLEGNPSSLLAICFTGVKGDANWLLQQIQQYAADVWERYDTAVMSTPVVSHIVARLCGRFAAQSEDREWQSSLGLPGKHDNDDDQKSSWSRPLGVQTMILSIGNQRSEEPKLLIVEPSGRVLNPPARSRSHQVSLAAMGKESNKIQARLQRLLKGEQKGKEAAIGPVSVPSTQDETKTPSWEDLPPTYERCRDALIRILLEETTITNSNSGSNHNTRGGELMIESYSVDRGKIERQLFRYPNSNNFDPV
mmetsp:Transcript_14573/g.40501  ORF Transcript_14573/g.40501 Transcript_14573/m.40501 type:complete len:375 (-) Transcript_14573:189-1313(-)